MRQSRLKAPESWPQAYYHCVSRVVDRRLAFDEEDKRQFVKFMRLYEQFCQVRVITYCVMSNHFHLLVEVPARPKVMPSEDQLLAHISRCYGKRRAWMLAEELKQLRARGLGPIAQKLIQSWLGRMWDLSSFMKTLKQRFTQWHNKRYERCGTLWEDRYRSTIVEGGTGALAMVGAYIDLNPVRAGLLTDPKDYRWSGYGAAVAGQKAALRGVEKMMEYKDKTPPKGLRALEKYRVGLFETAKAPEPFPKASPPVGVGEQQPQSASKRKGIPGTEVIQVRKEQGKLSRWEMLRCRVRYFSAGAVLGSRQFVNEVFAARRTHFSAGRKEGAHPMRGADFEGLYTLRDIKIDVFG